MIQVLNRASRLLELLAETGAAGRALGELATDSGLPPATCTRVLHDLASLGWVDQLGPRGRYRLGPRFAALAEARAYRRRLIAITEPILARLHERYGDRVVLAALRGDTGRLLLIEYGHPPGHARRYDEKMDAYASASGRALLAQLTWQQRRRWVNANSLPTAKQWPGVQRWNELGTECARIRRCGWAENHPAAHPWSGIGVAIPDGEGGWAAIGLSCDRADWSPAVIARTRDAARRVVRKLG
jgi:DNA-binding IclR family transcriptional regulator